MSENNHSISMKVCTKCKVAKDASAFGTRYRGLNSCCKQCVCVASKKWKSDNPEKHYGQLSRYKLKHPEKVKKWCAKWYAKNREPYLLNYKKKCGKKNTESLASSYLRAKLRQRGFTDEQIVSNPELLIIQKAILQIKRHAKQNDNKKS